MLRAHTLDGCGWSYLAAVAAQIRARLILVVHEPQPRPFMVDCLRLDGVRVLAPRALRLTTDIRALAVGLPPRESWLLPASVPVLWLPSVPVW